MKKEEISPYLDKELEVYCIGYCHQYADGGHWGNWNSIDNSIGDRHFEGLVMGGTGEKTIYSMWKEYDEGLLLYSLYGLEAIGERLEIIQIRKRFDKGIY